MDYENFDLRILQQSDGRYPILIEPSGELESLCADILSDRIKSTFARLDAYFERLKASAADSPEGPPPANPVDERLLEEVGTHLYKCLFHGKVLNSFNQEFGRIRDDPEKGLRIRLSIDPPLIAALPWELLYDPEGSRFLATWEKTLLTRRIRGSLVRRELFVDGTVKVLVAIPGYPGLSWQEEKGRVEEAFKALKEKGLVELDFLEGRVTTNSIIAKLDSDGYHIFHFVGHGCFDLNQDTGYLQINLDEDDLPGDLDNFDPALYASGTIKFLRSDAFANLFRNHSTMKLVVLNSCQGGQVSTTRPLVGLAPQLFKRDIPAVVAMQYPVFDDTSLIFASNFYRKLCAGRARGLIDVAITHARNSILVKRPDDLDFAVPVLFMNSASGLIFDLREKDDPPATRSGPPPAAPGGEAESATVRHADSKRRTVRGLNRGRRLLRGLTAPLRKIGEVPRLKALRQAHVENLGALEEGQWEAADAEQTARTKQAIVSELAGLARVERQLRDAFRASLYLTLLSLSMSLALFAASIYGLFNVLGIDDWMTRVAAASAGSPASRATADERLRTIMVDEQQRTLRVDEQRVEDFPSVNGRDDRRYFAHMIDALAAARAKVVAFDVYFPCPPEVDCRTQWDKDLANAIKRAAGAGTEVVFGVDGVTEAGAPVDPLPDDLREVLSDRWGNIHIGEEWAGFRPAYRSVILADRKDGGPQPAGADGRVSVAPSFILQAIRRFRAQDSARPPDPFLYPDERVIRLLDGGGRSVQDIPVVNDEASFNVALVGEDSLARIRHTFQDVYARRKDLTFLRSNFEGRLVIVGYREGDWRYVTSVRQMTGAEIQANVISNIFQGIYIKKLPWFSDLAIIFLMFSAGLLLQTRPGRRLRLRLPLELQLMKKELAIPVPLLVVTGAYLAALYFVYKHTSYDINMTYHLAALFLAYWCGRLFWETVAIRKKGASLTTQNAPEQRITVAASALLLILLAAPAAYAARSGGPLPAQRAEDDQTPSAKIESITVDAKHVACAPAADLELIRAGTKVAATCVEPGTPLSVGDELRTKANVRVRLRVFDEQGGQVAFVFLEPETTIRIGSFCLITGKLLALAGTRFRLCTRRGTLGVGKTEYQVEIDAQGEIKASVFEGEIWWKGEESETPATTAAADAPPRTRRDGQNRPARAAAPEGAEFVKKQDEIVIKSDGTLTTRPLPRTEAIASINYWTQQLLKLNQIPQVAQKEFINYRLDDARAQAFAKARLDALLEDEPGAYADLGKVFNDWQMGVAAAKSLDKALALAPSLADAPQFVVNQAEASRLSGRFEEARALASKALSKDPQFTPAYLVSGTVFAQMLLERTPRKGFDPEHLRLLEGSKIAYMKALQDGTGEELLNRPEIERSLLRTVVSLGVQYTSANQPTVAQEYWFLGQADITNYRGQVYSGTVSIDASDPRAAALNTFGDARLAIFGNQFILRSREKTLTGRIIGNTIRDSTYVAMRFDDPSLKGLTNAEGITISVRAMDVGGKLTLMTAPDEQKQKSLRFSAR